MTTNLKNKSMNYLIFFKVTSRSTTIKGLSHTIINFFITISGEYFGTRFIYHLLLYIQLKCLLLLHYFDLANTASAPTVYVI